MASPSPAVPSPVVERFDTTWFIRASKALLTFTVGGFALFVVFGNVTDYWTNFNFVSHVFSMDAQKPALHDVSNINYRAVSWKWFHHVAYVGVILTETAIMVTCLASAWRQARTLRAPDAAYRKAKRWGLAGCTIGLFLWFFGFQAVAGEWFGMWMNDTWNGIPDAVRLCTYIGIVLVYLTMGNDRAPREEAAGS
ncbi:DUF2165 family protein [Actinomadura verrucosospora]|uniref:Small integral membrane protein n=1 Tax=Actinomadura verrucosospora TaxID=46165 RepID=A0A7D4A3W5_ACTVE|nr:DUF2165 domain-containing protein [Actinomadura verrucosospora]QKG19767.1 small integral membrane protein [Actinomadura verrucosospora]